MELPTGIDPADGASCFVNPLTALAFTEVMRREGHAALVHTAAASNLGQMLVKICAKDGIPLVNIVRSAEQVALLKGIGASHVLNSTSDSFVEDLIAALTETGATLGFDAIGGGRIASQILGTPHQARQTRRGTFVAIQPGKSFSGFCHDRQNCSLGGLAYHRRKHLFKGLKVGCQQSDIGRAQRARLCLGGRAVLTPGGLAGKTHRDIVQSHPGSYRDAIPLVVPAVRDFIARGGKGHSRKLIVGTFRLLHRKHVNIGTLQPIHHAVHPGANRVHVPRRHP
jgi:hypothetical protein